MTFVTFGKLAGDERLGFPRHCLAEAEREIVIEQLVAANIARLENGGEDGRIGLGEPDRIFDAAGCVPDLETHVPQAVEQEFDDALAPGGLFVGEKKQKIDVGAGRQRAATITADRHDCEALGLGRIGGGKEFRTSKIEQGRDDGILCLREAFGTFGSASIGEETPLGLLARLGKRVLEDGNRLSAQRRTRIERKKRPLQGVPADQRARMGGTAVHLNPSRPAWPSARKSSPMPRAASARPAGSRQAARQPDLPPPGVVAMLRRPKTTANRQ